MFIPFITTGIGSLPHTDAVAACTTILNSFDVPFWPQFPRLSFRELMIPQFSEGIPLIKIDTEKKTIWVDKDNYESATKFLESYTDDFILPVSEDFAKGLYTFLRVMEGIYFAVLKGHITGPLTFSLGLKDNNGKPVYFDEEMREIILLALKAKIRWQVQQLKSLAQYVIIFIDEPVLSALGTSSYLGVNTEEALRLLKETSDAIKNAGAISGIHCCSKADWSLVINSGAGIISFDAYDYIESLPVYSEEFTKFLKEGGYLAWGIVPTTDAINNENSESLKQRFDRGLEILTKTMPSDLLLSQIILTPSCGAGSLSIEEAEKVFKTLGELKEILVESYT